MTTETDFKLEQLLTLWHSKKQDVGVMSYSAIFQEVFEKTLSEDEARKRFYGIDMLAQLLPKKIKPITVSTLLDDELTRLRDERNALRAERRTTARDERYLDILQKELASWGKIKRCTEYVHTRMPNDVENEMVIQLSDWHLSVQVDSVWNKYDLGEFDKRIETLMHEIHFAIGAYRPKKVHILVQGDMISGSIHRNLRLQNQEDIISQIILASEKLSEMITDIGKSLELIGTPVVVRFVAGNHERVTPNKDENLSDENYIRIIRWFCMHRVQSENISFPENDFGLTMCTFDIAGMKAAMLHGDYDGVKTVVPNVTTMTRIFPDIVFTGHIHHTFYEDIRRCRVIANGSLVGTDDFAEKQRLHSYPCQNIVVVKENRQVIPISIIVGD